MEPVKMSGAVVKGNVHFGKDCSVWYNAVVRCEEEEIRIGDRVNIQDCCVLHTGYSSPLVIGNDVTIGHGAVVHGCTVGNSTLIGMGSIIMNSSVIGNGCIVAAGAVVPERKTFPDGVLIMGCPAKVIRPLTEEEIRMNTLTAQYYAEQAVKEKAE
ncbi:MAG: gamma carbonic anhydrase family protein [Solobacterium sp.]|nr:gamma carbonic anhydrase family protein [Solobacterium sp.]